MKPRCDFLLFSQGIFPLHHQQARNTWQDKKKGSCVEP
jgi:hypothetical protein